MGPSLFLVLRSGYTCLPNNYKGGGGEGGGGAGGGRKGGEPNLDTPVVKGV